MCKTCLSWQSSPRWMVIAYKHCDCRTYAIRISVIFRPSCIVMIVTGVIVDFVGYIIYLCPNDNQMIRSLYSNLYQVPQVSQDWDTMKRWEGTLGKLVLFTKRQSWPSNSNKSAWKLERSMCIKCEIQKYSRKIGEQFVVRVLDLYTIVKIVQDRQQRDPVILGRHWYFFTVNTCDERCSFIMIIINSWKWNNVTLITLSVWCVRTKFSITSLLNINGLSYRITVG